MGRKLDPGKKRSLERRRGKNRAANEERWSILEGEGRQTRADISSRCIVPFRPVIFVTFPFVLARTEKVPTRFIHSWITYIRIRTIPFPDFFQFRKTGDLFSSWNFPTTRKKEKRKINFVKRELGMAIGMQCIPSYETRNAFENKDTIRKRVI